MIFGNKILLLILLMSACAIGYTDDKTKKIITHFSYIWTSEIKDGPSIEINKALMFLAIHTMKEGLVHTVLFKIRNVRIDKTQKGTIIVDFYDSLTRQQHFAGQKPKKIRADVYITLTDKKTMIFDNKKYKRD